MLQDDLPRETADNEPMFATTYGSLELTDHQKKMLEPPEKRLSELRFPKSFEDRVRRQRRGDRRKSKWASKFRGLFMGKSASKWLKRQRAGEDLAPEARGIAKAKKETAPEWRG